LYKGQKVKIYDFDLENITHQGVFTGINEYGHAILEGQTDPIIDGRMRI
jgi:hypothetical protein